MTWIVNKGKDDEHSFFSVFSGKKILYNSKILQLYFIYISYTQEYVIILINSGMSVWCVCGYGFGSTPKCGCGCGITVWYGMAWHGIGWYGKVWYGMVWYGMIRYGMVWNSMEWHNITWHGNGNGSFR